MHLIFHISNIFYVNLTYIFCILRFIHIYAIWTLLIIIFLGFHSHQHDVTNVIYYKKPPFWNFSVLLMSLLSLMLFVLTCSVCSRAKVRVRLSACMLGMLTCLRAFLLRVLACLRARGLGMFPSTRAYVFVCFAFLLFLSPYVLTCLTCLMYSNNLRAYLLVCLVSLLALFNLHLKS